MLGPRRLGHSQNPSPQDPAQFSDTLLEHLDVVVTVSIAAGATEPVPNRMGVLVSGEMRTDTCPISVDISRVAQLALQGRCLLLVGLDGRSAMIES